MDQKFASPSARVTNRVELIDILERRLKEETRDVWMTKFKGRGCVLPQILVKAFLLFFVWLPTWRVAFRLDRSTTSPRRSTIHKPKRAKSPWKLT
jgi:hypothetical protein